MQNLYKLSLQHYSGSGLTNCPIRGNPRIEMMLGDALTKPLSEQYKLLEHLLDEGIFEYCYKNPDVGKYKGIVPKSFLLHFAAHLVHSEKTNGTKINKGTHDKIALLIDDCIVDIKNYSVLKSSINRAEVYNTDLLFFSGAFSYLSLTETPSQRLDLIAVFFKKSVEKSLLDRSLSGHFYYHSKSFSKPINYSVMVAAIINKYGVYLGKNFSKIILAEIRKFEYELLKGLKENFQIDWKKFSNDDKAGCVWADVWLIGCLPTTEPDEIERNLCNAIMSRDGFVDHLTGKPDPFFESWYILSLLTLKNAENLKCDIFSRERAYLLPMARFIFASKRFWRQLVRGRLAAFLIGNKFSRKLMDFGPNECHD